MLNTALKLKIKARKKSPVLSITAEKSQHLFGAEGERITKRVVARISPTRLECHLATKVCGHSGVVSCPHKHDTFFLARKRFNAIISTHLKKAMHGREFLIRALVHVAILLDYAYAVKGGREKYLLVSVTSFVVSKHYSIIYDKFWNISYPIFLLEMDAHTD